MSGQQPLRIVIAGGGTGGHVLPAIAVVDDIHSRGIDVQWLWIGSAFGVERDAAETAGIPFAVIPTGKLRRYLDLQTVTDAVRVPVGAVNAWRLLRWFRPHAVFSTGGFVSVPTVSAAARQCPILTHEQTAILGLATRIDMRFADTLALSHDQTWPATEGFRRRRVVTGNPVRVALAVGNRDRGRDRWRFPDSLPMLFVTGGARGASPINQRIEVLLPGLLEHCVVLHQTGPVQANGDFDRLRALRETWPAELQCRYHVTEFIREEIADAYAAADLVLARAGAGTVAELTFLGKPSVLIPLPLSGGGEQDANANVLQRSRAAVVLPQDEASPDRLKSTLLDLLTNEARLSEMSSAANSLARPDAAARLADELLLLARRG